MSAPDEEQAVCIINRMAVCLNEWRDVRYVLAIQLPDGGYAIGSRCSDRNKLTLVSCLLDQVLESPEG